MGLLPLDQKKIMDVGEMGGGEDEGSLDGSLVRHGGRAPRGFALRVIPVKSGRFVEAFFAGLPGIKPTALAREPNPIDLSPVTLPVTVNPILPSHSIHR